MLFPLYYTSTATPPTPSRDTGSIHFFRETGIPYDVLSHCHTNPFTVPSPYLPESEGFVAFRSTEQYMMYHKAIVFQDRDIPRKDHQRANVKKAEELGRAGQELPSRRNGTSRIARLWRRGINGSLRKGERMWIWERCRWKRAKRSWRK